MPLLGISDTSWGKSPLFPLHTPQNMSEQVLASEDNKLIEDVEELYEIKHYKETTKMVQEVARKKNGQ